MIKVAMYNGDILHVFEYTDSAKMYAFERGAQYGAAEFSGEIHFFDLIDENTLDDGDTEPLTLSARQKEYINKAHKIKI